MNESKANLADEKEYKIKYKYKKLISFISTHMFKIEITYII